MLSAWQHDGGYGCQDTAQTQHEKGRMTAGRGANRGDSNVNPWAAGARVPVPRPMADLAASTKPRRPGWAVSPCGGDEHEREGALSHQPTPSGIRSRRMPLSPRLTPRARGSPDDDLGQG